MAAAEFLLDRIRSHFSFEPTGSQERFFRTAAAFLTSDEGDILVLNGYAGTGKTSAVSAVVAAVKELGLGCELLAPTGRAAKVFSNYSGLPAHTIHKCIYRQRSVGDDGMGLFTIVPNKSRDTLFVVDEVSLIGIDAQKGEGQSVFGSGDLLGDLVSYVRNGCGCRLIMVGDAAQLPPVGLEASPALCEPFMQERFSGVRFETLTDVVRQASGSGILRNATILREIISTSAPDDLFEDLKLDLRECPDIRRIDGSELIDALQQAQGRYGDDGTVVLCRSNKRAIRYNLGIRSRVQFKEEQLLRGDKLMIVKNCYAFLDDSKERQEKLDYIANGDIAVLRSVRRFEERYGLHFAEARLAFPDYDGFEVTAKVCLDTLSSESASLTYEQQNTLYQGVNEDYSHITSRKKRYDAVREDPYYNALQLKYAEAITCHKSQGGQWEGVFIDCPFWQDVQTLDDLKWLYTALTRATSQVWLVNFPDRFFV